MARPMKIAWRRPPDDLLQLYRSERDGQIARRWQALGLLQQGERLIRVRQGIGVSHKTTRRWVRWYEGGGIPEAARPRWGGPGNRKRAWG